MIADNWNPPEPSAHAFPIRAYLRDIVPFAIAAAAIGVIAISPPRSPASLVGVGAALATFLRHFFNIILGAPTP